MDNQTLTSAKPMSVSPSMQPSQIVRFRHSCENCRRRKIKCSGTRPICDHCLKRGIQCIYRPLARSSRRPVPFVTTVCASPQPASLQSNPLGMLYSNSPINGEFSYASAPSSAGSPFLHTNYPPIKPQTRPATAIPPYLNTLEGRPMSSQSVSNLYGSSLPNDLSVSFHSEFGNMTSPISPIGMDALGGSSAASTNTYDIQPTPVNPYTLGQPQFPIPIPKQPEGGRQRNMSGDSNDSLSNMPLMESSNIQAPQPQQNFSLPADINDLFSTTQQMNDIFATYGLGEQTHTDYSSLLMNTPITPMTDTQQQPQQGQQQSQSTGGIDPEVTLFNQSSSSK